MFVEKEKTGSATYPPPRRGNRGVESDSASGYVGTTSYRQEVEKTPKGNIKIPIGLGPIPTAKPPRKNPKKSVDKKGGNMEIKNTFSLKG